MHAYSYSETKLEMELITGGRKLESCRGGMHVTVLLEYIDLLLLTVA